MIDLSVLSKVTDIVSRFSDTTKSEAVSDYMIQEVIEKLLDIQISLINSDIKKSIKVEQNSEYKKVIEAFLAKYSKFYGDK